MLLYYHILQFFYKNVYGGIVATAPPLHDTCPALYVCIHYNCPRIYTVSAPPLHDNDPRTTRSQPAPSTARHTPAVHVHPPARHGTHQPCTCTPTNTPPIHPHPARMVLKWTRMDGVRSVAYLSCFFGVSYLYFIKKIIPLSYCFL